MKKGNKPPAERRKELIDTAARPFAERGYESVSVRDILAEVNGAPGMFYYYFTYLLFSLLDGRKTVFKSSSTIKMFASASLTYWNEWIIPV